MIQSLLQDVCFVAETMAGMMGSNATKGIQRVRPQYIVEEVPWRLQFGITSYEPQNAFKKIQDCVCDRVVCQKSKGKRVVPFCGGHHFSGWPCVQFTGRHLKRRDDNKAIAEEKGPSGAAFKALLEHVKAHPPSLFNGENARRVHVLWLHERAHDAGVGLVVVQ